MLPPGLSMLWEAVDPVVALRERFGFGDLAEVEGWAATALDETWGITARACSRLVISDANAVAWVSSDRGDLVVKWSSRASGFDRLAASARLLRALGDRGLPVAAPWASRDGRDRVVRPGPAGDLSVTVLPERAGTWLAVDDHAAVHAAGAGLAHLHRALGDLPADGVATVPGLRDRITLWSAVGDRGLAPEASLRLRDLLSATRDLDDEPQVVHNDFRAANILVRGAEVVAVLDFDDVVVDHRVHDLAKACTYLGTLFTGWAPTPPATQRGLRAGYESVRPLSPSEAAWFEVVLLWHGIMAIPGPDDPAGWTAAV